VQLTVGNVSDHTAVQYVIVAEPAFDRAQWSLLGALMCCNQWDPVVQMEAPPDRSVPLLNDRPLAVAGRPPILQLHIPTTSYGSSVRLGEHGRASYLAQGSRAMFGYSFMFTPMIPIFMAGEEFDATLDPIPWESSHIIGAKDAGEGTMLYGSMLDWSELNQPLHQSMLDDVKQNAHDSCTRVAGPRPPGAGRRRTESHGSPLYL